MMGIQYVTVKVDTSGLYQPVSAPVGIVGIIGQAPSAGAGFNNPFPFIYMPDHRRSTPTH